MAEQEQKIIFGKNLSYYVSKTGKMQKEVAKDLKINPTTFNMWCTGKIMPNVSKIKDLANYFGIFFFELTEERNANSAGDFYLSPLEKKIISKYRDLSSGEQGMILRMLGIEDGGEEK